MSSWGWSDANGRATYGSGSGWIRAIIISIPYLTVMLLLLMLYMIGGTFAISRGAMFELPVNDYGGKDAVSTKLVALVVPSARDTLVFFDDTRYLLNDQSSFRLLGETIGEGAAHRNEKSLLVLADRRVACGDLIKLTEMARTKGIERVLFAEKRAENDE